MRERDRLLLGLAAGAGMCLVGKEMLAAAAGGQRRRTSRVDYGRFAGIGAAAGEEICGRGRESGDYSPR